MSVSSWEEIIKLQPKGVLTIPKRLRIELGLENNDFLRIKKERGRLVIERVRTLPYQVRSYSNQEIDEFYSFDKEETEQLKKKGIVK